MKTRNLLIAGVMAVGLYGCAAPPTPEEMGRLRLADQMFSGEIAAIKADLPTVVDDPELRAELERRLAQLEPIAAQVHEIVTKVEAEQDMSYLFEGALTSVGLAFPPAAAATSVIVLLVRMLRRQRANLKAVFEAIEAAGGPVDPAKAKAMLVVDPEAYKAYKLWEADHNTQGGTS